MSGQPPLEGRESLVLRWMCSAPGRRRGRVALAPSGFAAVAARRVGLAGLAACLAWYASLSVAEFPETAFALLAPHVSRPMLYLLPIWSVGLGVVLLLAVRVCLPAARWLVPLPCFTLWPALIALTGLPEPALVWFPLGFAGGIGMLALEPRWESLRLAGRARRAAGERLILGVVPAATILSGAAGAESPALSLFAVLMAALSSLIAFRAHASFLSMCRYLTALREPGDGDGGRSALIVMACLWLWPVWVFDGWGWFVTGGPSRR